MLLVSIDAMTPLTRQCAWTPSLASTHIGAANVTPRTGSPIAEVGTELPRRSAEHSTAVMPVVRDGDGDCAAAIDGSACRTMPITYMEISLGILDRLTAPRGRRP